MELHEIDGENELYVYINLDGSCGTIGFNRASIIAQKVYLWLEMSHQTPPVGTREAFDYYVTAMRIGQTHYMETKEKCEAELDHRFTQYYESGERVEVEWKDGYEDYTGYGARTDGKKGRFYVGKSSGWMPIYLMIQRRDSHGGGAISPASVKSIRGLGVFKRR